MQRWQETEGQRDMRLQVSTDSRLCNWEPRAPRKTRRAHKQSHVASRPGEGGRAKSRLLFRQQREETGQRPGINTAPRQPRSIPGVRRDTRPFPAPAPSASAGTPCAHPGSAALHTSFPTLVLGAACVLPTSFQLGASPGPAKPVPGYQSVQSVGRVRARYHAVPWAGLAVSWPELGEDSRRLEALPG